MKKIIVISLMFLMILSVSVFAVTCDVYNSGTCSESGYTYCDWSECYYQCTHSYAKIYWSIEDGNGLKLNDILNQQGGYAVEKLHVPIGSVGDHRYWYNNLLDWNEVVCNENGCNGASIDGTTDITLAIVGMEYTDCPAFIAWDRDDCSGYWSWTRYGRGFVGPGGNCFAIPVVNCYQDSDCPSGHYCDKSGSWQSWHCDLICGNGICDPGETNANCPQDCPPICGNGIIESGNPPEKCDGTNLGGQTCISQGYDAGALACQSDCLNFDFSDCSTCGDGVCEGTEDYLNCPQDCLEPCTCIDWANSECSNTSTTEIGYRNQNRTCDPAGCDVETRVVEDETCKKSNVGPIISAIVIIALIIIGLYAYVRYRTGKGFRRSSRRRFR